MLTKETATWKDTRAVKMSSLSVCLLEISGLPHHHHQANGRIINWTGKISSMRHLFFSGGRNALEWKAIETHRTAASSAYVAIADNMTFLFNWAHTLGWWYSMWFNCGHLTLWDARLKRKCERNWINLYVPFNHFVPIKSERLINRTGNSTKYTETSNVS
jgi:hypothetical protein